tara:strand:+ start:2156 stop:2539 length:384 start_codon:yes stop_codon:yes gene_type:complete
MTKSKKIWLGILTFLPIAFIIIYIICFALYMMTCVDVLDSEMGDSNVTDPSPFFAFFGIMFVMMFFTIISAIGLMIYYIIHANNNPKFDSNQKLLWILVQVFAGGIGNIVYYFVEILPKDTPHLPPS